MGVDVEGVGRLAGELDPRATPRSRDLFGVFVRAAATTTALLPALIGLAGLAVILGWARHRTSLACSERSSGQSGRVVHGGWADHTYCTYPGGNTRPVLRESISWFEPLPWTAFVVVSAIVVLVGTASLMSRLWNGPPTFGPPIIRTSVLGIAYLYGLALGTSALFLFTMGTIALATAPLVALVSVVAAISAGAATFILVMPAPEAPLPNVAPILLGLSAPLTIATLAFVALSL